MQERKLHDAAQQKQAFDSYVREATGTSGGDVTSQLTQLADLRAQGVLTDSSSRHRRPRFWLRADTKYGRQRQKEEPQMAEGNETLGPISYLVVEFPGNKMTGEGLPILVDLVDRGIIRILDLVFVAKGQDGSLGIIGLADLDHDGDDRSGRLRGRVVGPASSQEDLADAAPVIAPGSSAAILIFENRWATTFVQALRRGDAQLVAAGYIPQDDLAAALDAAEAERRPTCPLLRGIARTAAIAGTATAVSNRVSRRQQNRWAQQEDQQYAQQQPQYAHGAAPAAAAPARDQVAQLKDLAELKSQGILTDAEFDAQKAKILAS